MEEGTERMVGTATGGNDGLVILLAKGVGFAGGNGLTGEENVLVLELELPPLSFLTELSNTKGNI